MCQLLEEVSFMSILCQFCVVVKPSRAGGYDFEAWRRYSGGKYIKIHTTACVVSAWVGLMSVENKNREDRN